MRSTVHYILPGEGSDRLPEPDYSSLLPDYEAACASVMKQPPPPSYAVAMACQPPAYANTQVIAEIPPHTEFATTYPTLPETEQTEPATAEGNNNVEQHPQGNVTGTPPPLTSQVGKVTVEQHNSN